MSKRYFALLAVLAATNGCAEPPSGPHAASPPWSRQGETEPQAGGPPASERKFAVCTRREAQFGSALIGPSGGTLVVGNSYLLIPPGALREETLITGTIPADTIAFIKFEPSGLEFRKPAALMLDAAGCDMPTDAPDLVYIADDGTIREIIRATYSRFWKMVVSPISHFSGYAIAV